MRFRRTLAFTMTVAMLSGTALVAQVKPLGNVQTVGSVKQASFGGCSSCGAAAPMMGGMSCTSCGDTWGGYDCGQGACALVPPCGPICGGSAVVGELLCGIKNTVDQKLSCLLGCVFSGCRGPSYGIGGGGFAMDAGCGCADVGCDGGCAGGYGPSCGAAPMAAPVGPVYSTPTAPAMPAAPNAPATIDPFRDDPAQPMPSAGSTTRRPVYSIRRTSFNQQQLKKQPAGAQKLQRVGTGVLGPFTPHRINNVRRTVDPRRQGYTGSKPLVRFQD